MAKRILTQEEMRGIGCVCVLGSPIRPECKLHGHLAKQDPDGVLGGVTAPELEYPVKVTACHRPETNATAFLCFSEDELDNWWNGLDVEAKADAFAGFSLRAQGQDESFVHIDDRRVPIIGKIGESRAVTQPDGAGDEAVQS